MNPPESLPTAIPITTGVRHPSKHQRRRGELPPTRLDVARLGLELLRAQRLARAKKTQEATRRAAAIERRFEALCSSQFTPHQIRFFARDPQGVLWD